MNLTIKKFNKENYKGIDNTFILLNYLSVYESYETCFYLHFPIRFSKQLN
jgi:hypothetical protein